MCGRMTLTRSGEEIAEYFAQALARRQRGAGEAPRVACGGAPRELDGGPLRSRFNLAPSQQVLTLVPAPIGSGIASDSPSGNPSGSSSDSPAGLASDTSSDPGSDTPSVDAAAFAWKRWGLVPSWARDPSIGARMFNARAETADTKPSFRAAWKRRRCVVAADGFYEWTPRNRGHRPFLFRPARAPLLAFAGLFEAWRGEGGETIESCTVVTTEANADLEGVHHRMPVILAPEQLAQWLDPLASPEAVRALAISAPPGTLERTPVGRYVNDPRHDDARCLAPEEPAEQAELFALDGGGTSAGRSRAEPSAEEF